MSNDTLDITTGTVLRNGATVVIAGGFSPGGGGLVPSTIVLAKSRGEWVTWEVNLIDGEAFWGHYFSDHLAGMADFEKRTAGR